MKKRTLALFCAVVMVFSMCAMSIQANATEEQYRVGYSIQDMNPWVDPTDPSKGIIEGLALSGRGAGDNGRGCTGIADDNCNGVFFGEFWADTNGNGSTDPTGEIVYNGKVDTIIKGTGYDEGDGLQTTCTAITDANGYTALFVTVDALGAYSKLTNDIRAQIIKSIEEQPELWKDDTHPNTPVVSPEGITVSGSHTHSSFRFSDAVYGTYPEGEPVDDANKYYKYVVDQIVLAAQKAWTDSAPATMYKNSVNVSEVLDGNYQLNFVRQWNRTYYATVDGQNGRFTFNVVEGSNFGTEAGIKNYLAKKYNVTTDEVHVEKKQYAEFATGRRDSTPLASANGEVLDADDMMHLIEFQFADTDKKPVVMLNWRAHTTENGGDFFGAVSSDYVGPLRALLAKEGYRVAFFLGAAGNLVVEFNNSQGRYLTPWYGEKTSEHKSDVHLYAELLTEAAKSALGKGKGMIPAGDIRVITSRFAGEKRTYTDAQKDAVNELVEKYRKDLGDGKYDDSAWRKDWKPYPYIASNGTVINSYFEAGCIYDRQNNAEGPYNITLSAISLGDYAAFVTAPYELSDRYYSEEALAAGDLMDNLWEILNTVGTYGTPFVLSCTNNYVSYLPSSVEYIYNTEAFAKTFKQAEDGATIFGAGSYESHISPVKAGAGEKMVEHFKRMLTTLAKDEQREAYCEVCQKNVIWTAVYNDKLTSFGSGHFYLCEDITADNGVRVYSSENLSLCIDLNGKKYEVNDRALHPLNNSTMSILDSGEGGQVVSNVVDDTYGATVVVSGTATFNWYGGTLSCNAPTSVSRAIYNIGTVNVCGGNITSNDKAAGNGLYLVNKNSKVKLSGNAHVDEIYVSAYNYNNSQLTVNGGTANVVFATEIPLEKNQQIGTGTDGSGLTVNNGQYSVKTSSKRLYLDDPKPDYNEPVSIGATKYTSLGDALKAYESGIITLDSNITESVKLTKDTYIDLNGKTVSGNITVPTGKTLYVMDSKTDDYDINDGEGYGKITGTINGDYKGAFIPGDEENKNYVMITENSAISFHRVFLDLTHVTLKVSDNKPSIKYKGKVQGDQLVAEHTSQYGVAFSLSGAPVLPMTEGTYSSFTGLTPGKLDADEETPGTYLVNIMQPGQTDYLNGMNAKTNIYGSAYIVVDGEYYFGETAERSLRQVVQETNSYWDSLEEPQKIAVVNMYKQFEGNMKYWGLTNIMAAAN